jgi:aspartate/methionine/tyrosine aminotransferase
LKTAQRLDLLQTENAFEVLAEVKKLTAAGRDIVSFAIGEPDFDTPENIKQAGIDAIKENQTHYSPAGGLPELRSSIAAYYSRTRGIKVSPDHVVVTPGAKPIILYSLLACVDPGDEVIYPNPGFPIYQSLIGFLGAKTVPVPVREINGQFTIDPEELKSLITDKTKMIIINSPHNPTGGVLQQEVLAAVAEIAIKNNLWILSDEIYSRIIYQDKFYSIASLPGMQERTIILDGFSKTYAMTGWRIGYAAAPVAVAKAMADLQSQSTSNPTSIAQAASVEAINGDQASLGIMLAEFDQRRRYMVERLRAMPGVNCNLPGGAFYVFPEVSAYLSRTYRGQTIQGAADLARILLDDARVAVVPGVAFGDDRCFRLSYATSMEKIKEGLDRLEVILKEID